MRKFASFIRKFIVGVFKNAAFYFMGFIIGLVIPVGMILLVMIIEMVINMVAIVEVQVFIPTTIKVILVDGITLLGSIWWALSPAQWSKTPGLLMGTISGMIGMYILWQSFGGGGFLPM